MTYICTPHNTADRLIIIIVISRHLKRPHFGIYESCQEKQKSKTINLQLVHHSINQSQDFLFFAIKKHCYMRGLFFIRPPFFQQNNEETLDQMAKEVANSQTHTSNHPLVILNLLLNSTKAIMHAFYVLLYLMSPKEMLVFFKKLFFNEQLLFHVRL